MSSAWWFSRRHIVGIVIAGLGVGLLFSSEQGRAESCSLVRDHAGLTFPVERVDPAWTCRLQPIVQGHTTESKIGPIRAALSESMYQHLLDHPPFTAALIRRLHLGRYESEVRGPGRFWGDDGEGTKGIVQLVYEDLDSRIYYLEGSHESRLLPHVTGKAVIFLRTGVVREPHSHEAIDSTLVAYTKLDNWFLAGVVSFLHPLVAKIVTSRLQKGVETVNRLGVAMRQDPQWVLSEAAKPPSLPEGQVVFLKNALSTDPDTDKALPHHRSFP
ncbi:MAG: hypothetical protein OEV99_10510 [Nitrospira sp.]|nr:hypothetical protein [Nitrospira sp.]MDH4370266.1 hypothetical protein [Nitrospira sp.]MDH5499262.1 hypothetical protein [Nitrospira sp.]MDH5726760.1 hypothetical protein [Nitrospira sp.]